MDAVFSVRHGVLIRILGDGQTLQTDPQPFVIHHREHRLQATIGFADHPAFRIFKVHDACARAFNAHLLFDGTNARSIALARVVVRVRHKLRNQEKADSTRTTRCIRKFGENQMDDVVGEILLAAGDEDFRAGDGVGAIVLRNRARPHHAEVGASVRLG